MVGNGDLNNKLINEATQTKTEQDKEKKGKKTVTKSSYHRNQTVLDLIQ